MGHPLQDMIPDLGHKTVASLINTFCDPDIGNAPGATLEVTPDTGIDMVPHTVLVTVLDTELDTFTYRFLCHVLNIPFSQPAGQPGLYSRIYRRTSCQVVLEGCTVEPVGCTVHDYGSLPAARSPYP